MILGLGLGAPFSPTAILDAIRALFSSNEQGVVYDPSDMSTLFQDSAGTVPVTAVEQPVGRILDKSGRGNHATQAPTTKRPVYSRRVNLLTKTENMVPGTTWTRGAFGNWLVVDSLRPSLAPDGSNNAVEVRSVGTGTISTLAHRSSVFPSTTYKFTVQVRKAEGEEQTGLPGLQVVFHTGNDGVLVSTGAASVVIGTSVSGSWQQFEISYTTPGTGVNQVEVGLRFASGASAAVAVWGASLTLSTDAHLPYQRVNTATDYDADPAKFPAYLRFDGVDDALQTGNIDFTGTDKMTVWAGVTKLRDAEAGIVCELSAAATGINPGSFGLAAPLSASYRYVSQGEFIRPADYTHPSMAAPHSVVATGLSDIAGDAVILRIAGAQAGQNMEDGGTGTYGNYPLYIGARAGTSLYFNGRLYGLIVRGAQSTLSQIEATELYMKKKARIA